jgi:cytochrome c oxidase subunit 2
VASEPTQPDGIAPLADEGRFHIRRVLRIWASLSVVLIALAIIVIPLVERKPGSSVAGFASLTDLVFTVAAIPVAVFVWVFVFYSVATFRERSIPEGGSVEDLEDGPPLEAQPRHQVWWLGITTALAFFTVGWGMFGFYKETTSAPAHPLLINVVGQEWTWTFAYPGSGAESHELELPLGRPVQFRVTSDDVLHGFSVAGLGITMDANPGEWIATPIVTPNQLGNYEVRCNELCGLYHTFMWSRVRVVQPRTYEAWLKANTSRRGTLPGPSPSQTVQTASGTEEAIS